MKKILAVILSVAFLLPQLAFVSSAAEELPVSEIFSRAEDALALVVAKEGHDGRTGTGFVVSGDGLILTSYHVVRSGDIYVRLNSKKIYGDVQVVGYSERHDLALIRIRETGLKTVVLGDSSRVSVGEKVVAIGNPMGLESTVSDGIVSSLRKTETGMELIQISAPVSSGSSGGPVFNMQGKVVGVTASTTAEGQNLNFAVPINYASPLLAKFIKPSRSFLGKGTAPLVKKAPVRENSTVYVIQAGDTLTGIAKQFDTTVESIVRLNDLSGTTIYSGQKIKIPKI